MYVEPADRFRDGFETAEPGSRRGDRMHLLTDDRKDGKAAGHTAVIETWS